MSYAFQISTLSVLYLISTVEAICPAETTEMITNVCVHKSTDEKSYCDAHKYCYEYGLPRNKFYFLIGKDSLIVPVDQEYWTSVNSLLILEGQVIPEWRVGDPNAASYTIPNKDITWSSGEPYMDYVRQLSLESDGFKTRMQTQELTALCQFSPKPPLSSTSNPNVERFQANWNTIPNKWFAQSEDTHGCYDITVKTTLIQCVFRCKTKIVCRSAYFNEKSQTCILSLYVEALLPSDQPRTNSWIHFGRPDW